jgi:hypothetical protein
MTSPAQVFALARALYGVPEEIDMVLALAPEKGQPTVAVGVGMPNEILYKIRVSANDPSPLETLRDELIDVLVARIRSDVEALSPFMGQVACLEPLVRLGLMLRFGKAYIALRRATAPGSETGGERGRAAQHAYEDAAAALMAHIEYQVN